MGTWKTNLKSIVEDADTTAGRTFDVVIQILIFLSMISFSLETLPDLPTNFRRILRVFEIVAVACFSIEYLLRLFVADNRFNFIFSFFGMVDLFAVLPFYLSLGIDLRSIRAIRLLRLFRVVKLARYNKAIRRYHRAFLLAREELALFLAMALVLFYLSAVGIYYCENTTQPDDFASVFHSFWWAIITLTTVGYGDVYPVTLGGRLFTFVVLIIGLVIVALPSGIFAAALSKAREMED